MISFHIQIVDMRQFKFLGTKKYPKEGSFFGELKVEGAGDSRSVGYMAETVKEIFEQMESQIASGKI